MNAGDKVVFSPEFKAQMLGDPKEENNYELKSVNRIFTVISEGESLIGKEPEMKLHDGRIFVKVTKKNLVPYSGKEV